MIFQGYIMFENPSIAKSSKVVVADIYDPFHLEQLEQARDLVQADRRNVVRSATDVLNEQLRARRLLPVREHEAARLLARVSSPPSAASTR